MPLRYIFSILIIIALVCFDNKGQGGLEHKPGENQAVSFKINNSLSDFEGSDYIDKKMKYFIDRWELNGVSVAVAKDGKLVFAKGYGYADIENNIKVEPWHIFRLASVSKLITATAIMKLKEDNILSLDEKVFGKEGILNDSVFLDIRDRKMKEITVEHLLRHEAGFSVRAGDPMFRPLAVAKCMNVPAPADFNSIIRYVLKRRLRYRPGTRMVYSNFGYALLSKIIEKKTGMSYEMYVKRNILEPCGVYDMKIANNRREEKYINEVCYYEQSNSLKIHACDGSGEQVFRSNGGNDIRTLSGAGAWVGSAAEMLKFVCCIDGMDNKPDILTKESVKYMTEKIPGKSPIGWMKIDYQGNWWRTGTLAGSTVLLKRENNGLSWIIVSNTSSWRGSKFPKTINYEMKKILRNIKEWPDCDFFNYHIQKPVVINMINDEYTNFNCS